MRTPRDITLEDIHELEDINAKPPSEDNPLYKVTLSVSHMLEDLLNLTREAPEEFLTLIVPNFISIAERGLHVCRREYQTRRDEILGVEVATMNDPNALADTIADGLADTQALAAAPEDSTGSEEAGQ